MKKNLTIFILLVFFVSLRGQEHFVPGFVIRNSGDTLYGYINSASPENNSRFCVFKPDLSSPAVNYTPADINAYGFVDGDYYVSKNIQIDSLTRTVFLRFLIKGKINLYSYLEDLSKIRYYAEKDSLLVELTNTQREHVNEFNINT